MFKATVNVKLRQSILDTEGKAIEQALKVNIAQGISNVRVGKEIELFLDASDKQEAEALIEKACSKILANTVMEDYSFHIEEVTN